MIKGLKRHIVRINDIGLHMNRRHVSKHVLFPAKRFVFFKKPNKLMNFDVEDPSKDICSIVEICLLMCIHITGDLRPLNVTCKRDKVLWNAIHPT